MRLLLDTHVLLWSLMDDKKLKERTRGVIADPNHVIYVSAASGWELAIKAGLGRIQIPAHPEKWLPKEMERARFFELPVSLNHTLRVAGLPHHHEDPFDRLLVAQALAENLVLATSDPVLKKYGVEILPA